MNEPKNKAAGWADDVADELELAVKHCRTAARHMRDDEVPRYAAHMFAAQGHVSKAQDRIEEMAKLHAEKSNPE